MPTTWNQHLQKCSREWHEMKKAAEKEHKKKKEPPPKVPKRIRGKQTDSQNDIQ